MPIRSMLTLNTYVRLFLILDIAKDNNHTPYYRLTALFDLFKIINDLVHVHAVLRLQPRLCAKQNIRAD